MSKKKKTVTVVLSPQEAHVLRSVGDSYKESDWSPSGGDDMKIADILVSRKLLSRKQSQESGIFAAKVSFPIYSLTSLGSDVLRSLE